MSRLEAFMKTFVTRAFHDKATSKDLFIWIVKNHKKAFADETSHTFRFTQSTLDLWERIEQDVATWSANSSKATNNEGD